MSGLAGHVALITGSSRSIGKAIAIRMAADGADIVVNGRSGNIANRPRARSRIAQGGNRWWSLGT